MSDSETNTAPPQNTRNARNRRKPRTVSSLTAQQIRHKRDLDRKAQRALRQRAKSRTQDLENDLALAKSCSSDRERRMMDEIQSLRHENRRLGSCLESIAEFALGGTSVEENVQGADDSRSPGSGPIADNEHPVHTTQPATDGNQPEHVLPCESAQQQHIWSADPRVSHDNAQGHPGGLPGTYHGNTASTGIQPPSPESSSVAGHSIVQPAQRDEYLDGTSQSLAAPITTGFSPASSIAANTILQPPTSSGIASVLPKHLSATCPLDQILLDFICSRRALATKGFSVDAVVGPAQPCLQAVLNPIASYGIHATSRVLGEVLSTFSHVSLPEKLAFMFVMFRTMRWQISPTDANYAEMPRWLRPTAVQITVPHAAWIDNITWPRVRDMLIENPEKYPFPVFSELYSQNVTVSWPYDPMDTISYQGDSVVFNPIFEKHARKLENWAVSCHFKGYLPEMTAAVDGRD